MLTHSLRPIEATLYGLTLLVLAGTTSPVGACRPLPSEPIPNYCEGKPDGTKLTLDREHDPEAIRDGTERATVTCNDGKIDGPATIYLDDKRDQSIPGSYSAAGGRLPSGSWIAEVERLTTFTRNRNNQGLYWNGSITVLDREERKLFESSIDRGQFIGEFTQWLPQKGVRRQGQYSRYWKENGPVWLPGGLNGLVEAWHRNGQRAEEGYFCRGVAIGKHIAYDRSGAWTTVQDFSLNDYNSSGTRRVVEPESLKGPHRPDSCGGSVPDFYPLLIAAAVKITIVRSRSEPQVAVGAMPWWVTGTWYRLPKDATFHQWFTPGSLIEQQQVGPFPRMTLQVPDDFDYVPLVERLERGQTASELEGMNRSIVEACGPWLRKAFELGPDL